MKIGLISTLNTNIGDDFIRLGIQRVISSILPDQSIKWEIVNKHKPSTVWPLFSINRFTPKQILASTGYFDTRSKFSDCNLIVQCGAPVIWENCSQCEWNIPIWQNVIADLHSRIPTLNIAIGSCYGLTSKPSKITNELDRTFIKSILSYCSATTARDNLSKLLCSDLGHSLPIIPCSASLAFPVSNSEQHGNFILMNYMHKAGHYDFDGNINEDKWLFTFTKLLNHIKINHKVILLCHSVEELKLASQLFPEIKAILPKNTTEYFEIAKFAKIGIFNRLHAAVALSGIGIPSIAIGNDTRIQMVEEFNLPVFNVHTCTSEALIETFENILENRKRIYADLTSLREHTHKSYITLFSQYIS